jgi:hypothetical protein
MRCRAFGAKMTSEIVLLIRKKAFMAKKMEWKWENSKACSCWKAGIVN